MMDHHFFPDAKVALAALEATVKEFNGAAGGRIRCWVNIEGKEPCSMELHVGARALAERLGVGRPIIWRPASRKRRSRSAGMGNGRSRASPIPAGWARTLCWLMRSP